ncbi:MAG: hypothetical protein Q7J54_05030 [Candidatus Woesearchaeota archaeon]|nr:hypothetical protein [Candidatus Woesearchaeota archaeon]
MEDKKAKQKLLEIFGNQIKFNKNFDDYIVKLKEGMLNDLIEWCRRCKENKELGSVPSKKEFKHLYVFFRKIASDVRAVLIKEQNKDFIEIILEDHKAYDDARLKLGYKKSSYYGS